MVLKITFPAHNLQFFNAQANSILKRKRQVLAASKHG